MNGKSKNEFENNKNNDPKKIASFYLRKSLIDMTNKIAFESFSNNKSRLVDDALSRFFSGNVTPSDVMTDVKAEINNKFSIEVGALIVGYGISNGDVIKCLSAWFDGGKIEEIKITPDSLENFQRIKRSIEDSGRYAEFVEACMKTVDFAGTFFCQQRLIHLRMYLAIKGIIDSEVFSEEDRKTLIGNINVLCRMEYVSFQALCIASEKIRFAAYVCYKDMRFRTKYVGPVSFASFRDSVIAMNQVWELPD